MDFWGLSMDGFSWFKLIILLIELIELLFGTNAFSLHFTMISTYINLDRCHPDKESRWRRFEEDQRMLGLHPRCWGPGEEFWSQRSLQTDQHQHALAPDKQTQVWHNEPWRLPDQTGGAGLLRQRGQSSYCQYWWGKVKNRFTVVHLIIFQVV